MLKSLHLKNFTVFSDTRFVFGKNLNIIVGENGSGKSHLLKAAYVGLSVSARYGSAGANDDIGEVPIRALLETVLAEKLRNVFRPDDLGRLVSRGGPVNQAVDMVFNFDEKERDMSLHFSRKARAKVEIIKKPTSWLKKVPIFLPTRELMTIYPGFVSLYETMSTQFEETWRDTCLQLGRPTLRRMNEGEIFKAMDAVTEAIHGHLALEESGRFYLKTQAGSMEMHLLAEGLRKLAAIERLIATGSLCPKGCLLWDEPEANLNPSLIKIVARAILLLAKSGVQVFIASHSLFLIRELHLLKQAEFAELDKRCFGLQLNNEGDVNVLQGKTMDDIGPIAALDEDLQQSDRYINVEMGLASQTHAEEE